MTSRAYPISQDLFNAEILPIILRHTTVSGGRPPKISHYVCFCAMLKMLSVSLPWRDCPKEYGPWHTIYTRFKRWSENGLLWNILYELKQKKSINIDIVFMDSTTVKVHRYGMGALKKKGKQSIGRNVAGNGTKIHVIMGKDSPVYDANLTGAQVNDAKVAMQAIVNLENSNIERFVADKGYDGDKIRKALNAQHIKADIPHRKNRLRPKYFDTTVYKWRWRIEALFGKLKENRRIALRVDKLDTSFYAFIALAFIECLVC